jgi:hypothetical protein
MITLGLQQGRYCILDQYNNKFTYTDGSTMFGFYSLVRDHGLEAAMHTLSITKVAQFDSLNDLYQYYPELAI